MYRTDQAILAALKPPVRSWLKANEVTEIVHGEDGQFEGAVLLGYEGDAGLSLGAESVHALAIIQAAMLPATRNDLLSLIANLWEGTSHAQSGGDNLKLKFAGYCAMLMEYPADVAREAIANWDRREKWWPARSELRAECDRLANWRRVTAGVLAC